MSESRSAHSEAAATLGSDALSSAVGIDCRSVTSGYLGHAVLKNISFRIGAPGVYVVLGPNGAGKTTLLRTIAGILRPTSGDVFIGGVSIDQMPARNRLHYVSHMDGIPGDLRVREALEFYAVVEGATSADVDRVLDLLEIRELSNSYVSQLSSGQRKRVSIGRVFLHERSIYLLDEPTSNLDPKVAGEIRALILKLSQEKVVLYSSHNLFEAREIGNWVIAIRAGELAVYDRMENLRSSHFVIGIRLMEPSAAVSTFPRQGDYYLRELPGPEAVSEFVRGLEAQGVKIREVREMGNPLEDLFQ
jgi:ABC-2 type transport system ATP-binding protein